MIASCAPTSREPTRREPSTSGRSGAPAQQKNSSKLSIQLNPLCSQLSPQPILNNDWSQQNCSCGPASPRTRLVTTAKRTAKRRRKLRQLDVDAQLRSIQGGVPRLGAATHGDRRRILHPRPAITAGRAERTDRLRRPGHAPRSAGAAFAGPTRSPTVRDNWPAAEPASASCPQPSRSGATGVRLATSRSPAAPDRRSPVSNVPRARGRGHWPTGKLGKRYRALRPVPACQSSAFLGQLRRTPVGVV